VTWSPDGRCLASVVIDFNRAAITVWDSAR
jgi:hypothetical protein